MKYLLLCFLMRVYLFYQTSMINFASSGSDDFYKLYRWKKWFFPIVSHREIQSMLTEIKTQKFFKWLRTRISLQKKFRETIMLGEKDDEKICTFYRHVMKLVSQQMLDSAWKFILLTWSLRKQDDSGVIDRRERRKWDIVICVLSCSPTTKPFNTLFKCMQNSCN